MRCDIGAIQKRQEVHVSQRNEIKRLVVESFSDALYFYRAAALHQLLYSDDNTTMLLLRRVSWTCFGIESVR